MSDVIEIYLNSKTANKQNNSTSSCTFNLPNIEVRQDEKAYVNVKQAVIPFSWYNVNETNNILNMLIGIHSYSISIPFGNYNINQLISYLSSQFLNFPGNDKGLTIAYSIQTNKLTFTHIHHTLQLLATSTCFELLGFNENTQYNATNTSGTIYVLTSVNGINLFVVRQVYIASDNFILNNVNASNPNDSNILASVSVTGNPNSVIQYENTTTRHLIHHLNNITNLQIKLLDQDSDLLNLNGVNWSITLELIIVKNII